MSPSESGADRPGGPPPPPWGSFPLTEIVVLVGLILLVAGFFVAPPRGPLMIGAGLVLGSLAGLELAAREHFAGYRSHSLVLAGAAALILMGGLWWFGSEVVQVAIPVRLAVVALTFVGLVWAFSRAFARRSGGSAFKLRGD